MRIPLILIVDDAVIELKILTDILRREQVEIAVAVNGEEALKIAQHLKPDLILLDIMMPGMDGFEVCRCLKQTPELKDIPVIFLSAQKTETGSIVRGFKIGAADYVTKPYNHFELISRVRTHLNLKFQTEQLQESEKRYRAVVNDQTEMICRFLPEGMLTFVNPAFNRFFGKTDDELIGVNIADLLPPEARMLFHADMDSIRSDGSVITREYRMMDCNGQSRWYEWIFRGITAGHVIEIQSVGRDITDRRYAEEAYHSLVDYSIQGLAILKHQRIIFANSMMTEITGYTYQELISLSPDQLKLLIYPSDRQRIWDNFIEHVPGQKASSRVSFRIIQKNNSVRWVDVYANRIEYRGCPSLQLTMVDTTKTVHLEKLLGERTSFCDMVGQSIPMQRVYTLIEQFAETDYTLLITGETGTGKEMVAEAVHKFSPRSDMPLIRVNCAALAENLLESELFGHVKGAFTGADKDKIGRFQAADKGTLFLDEISELGPRLQAKLLRVIERKEFERVGDSKTIQADVRIIAATNTNLKEQVDRGTFRKDLYYRLNIFSIHLPPLRERKEDIPLLIRHFIKNCAHRKNELFQNVSDISSDILNQFMEYEWPGNVRELKNMIEYACTVSYGNTIDFEHLPPEFKAESTDQRTVALSERSKILEVFKQTGGNKSKTARLLGITRTTLYKRLQKYHIDL